MDARTADPSNPLQGAANSGASLDRLIKAWGLNFDVSKVVSDKTYFTQLGGSEDGRPQVNPSFLQLPPEAMDTNDVATSQIQKVYIPFGGAFTGSPAEGLKEVVLMHSTQTPISPRRCSPSSAALPRISNRRARSMRWRCA